MVYIFVLFIFLFSDLGLKNTPLTLTMLNAYNVLLNFLVTVKAAPHECINRTGLL